MRRRFPLTLAIFLLAAPLRAIERGSAPETGAPRTAGVAATPQAAALGALTEPLAPVLGQPQSARPAEAAAAVAPASADRESAVAAPDVVLPDRLAAENVALAPIAGSLAAVEADGGRVFFDGDVSRMPAAVAAAAPSVPLSRFEQRLARVSRAAPVPVGRLSLAQAPKFRLIAASEKALRWGSGAVGMLAMLSMVAAFGVLAAPIGALAYRAASRLQGRYDPAPPALVTTMITEKEKLELIARVEGRLDLLLRDLSLPPWRRPLVLVDSSDGDLNMAASGEELDSRSTIFVGEGWRFVSDEEMDDTLAHELAHLHYGDGKDFLFSDRSEGIHDGLLLVAAGLLAAAAVVPVVLLRPEGAIGLAFGWAAPGILAWLLPALAALSALGAGLMVFAWPRLRERRADLFAVWAKGGRGLLQHFDWLVGRRTNLPAFASAVFSVEELLFSSHPRAEARIAYIKRAMSAPRRRRG